MSNRESVLRCAWLVNPASEPEQDVRLTIVDGQVADVTPVPPDERHLIEPVAILPRFVNVHTHLEFSGRRTPAEPALPFTDWITAVVTDRRGQSTDETAAAVVSGVDECRASGTGVIGEICTSDAGLAALSSTDFDGTVVAFRELLSFTRDRLDEQLSIARRHMQSAVDEGQPDVRPAFSPHAPYSVHPGLFEAAVDMARDSECCIAMHLAETQSELELLQHQSGEFVDFLSRLNLWDDSVLQPGTRILSYLEKLAQCSHALAIHGNYFTNEDIHFLSRHPQIATVVCPRTHAWFQHGPHPWKRLKAAGGTVLLGTDSRASNPDLNIWRELQCVAADSQEAIWNLLPMITTDAAAALKIPAEQFRITAGVAFNAVRVACTAGNSDQLDTQLSRTTAAPAPVSLPRKLRGSS